METKTWCPLPWIFQAVRNNGDLRVCCQANASATKGILKKPSGLAFNAKADSLEEARNAPLLKEVRIAMLKGEEHENCTRCREEDAAGIRSRRVYERVNWASEITEEKAREATFSDGTIDTNKTKVIVYDIRLGNKCNLKCRMCGPTDSSAWYADQVKLWGSTYHDSHGKVELIQSNTGQWQPKNLDYDWTDSEKFWSQIDKNIPFIRQIQTVGGEPLLISRHFDLLQRCIDLGYSQNISVEYNSNLSIIPERAWGIWRKFREIRIGVSLDGVAGVNEYIRGSSRWDSLERNIKRLDEAEGNFTIWIATTVQAYNILHLPEIMKWRLNSRFRRVNCHPWRPLITAHPLHNPKHLNVRILPPAYKALVSERFQDFFSWLEIWCVGEKIAEKDHKNLMEHARKILGGYESYMHAEDWSHLLPKFLKYSSTLDSLRGERLGDVLPELAEAIMPRQPLACQDLRLQVARE